MAYMHINLSLSPSLSLSNNTHHPLSPFYNCNCSFLHFDKKMPNEYKKKTGKKNRKDI